MNAKAPNPRNHIARNAIGRGGAGKHNKTQKIVKKDDKKLNGY